MKESKGVPEDVGHVKLPSCEKVMRAVGVSAIEGGCCRISGRVSGKMDGDCMVR